MCIRDRAFRILVEPADRKDALAMAHEIDDVAGNMALGRAGNAHRLVERDINMTTAALTHGPPVDTHLVNGFDLDPQGGAPTVDGDATRLDPGVGLTARADTGLAEEFVEAQASPSRGPK